jgi:hypothetical protein
MKRPALALGVVLVAGVTGWWAYRRLRSHPRTAAKVADAAYSAGIDQLVQPIIDRQRQVVLDEANEVARAANGPIVSDSADLSDSAAAGAQDVIGAAPGDAHEAADAGAEEKNEPGRRAGQDLGRSTEVLQKDVR